MRDTVYRLKHPQADFRGFFGGVDFYAGYGTTSSKATVIFLLDAGQGFKVCGLTPEERAELGASASPMRRPPR